MCLCDVPEQRRVRAAARGRVRRRKHGRCCLLDGPIPIGAETKALVCVVNVVRVRVKVQLVAKEADDVFSVRTNRVS